MGRRWEKLGRRWEKLGREAAAVRAAILRSRGREGGETHLGFGRCGRHRQVAWRQRSGDGSRYHQKCCRYRKIQPWRVPGVHVKPDGEEVTERPLLAPSQARRFGQHVPVGC
jgi:hypothetical protein